MTYLEKAIKVTEEFDNKNLSIKEWVESVLGSEYINYYSEEYIRRAENIFSLFVKKLNQEELNGLSFDIVKQIKEAKEELEKEKIKLRQEKNELSEKYGYKKLKFLEGNIADYTGVDEVDMVVTLHACDTATDFALDKAVGWNAKVILSVPCCQHELNGQMKNETLGPLFKYGLIKERMAALVTDALRAEYLESCGYDAQILEFIDMEHTPKNILIRAVKTGKIKECEEFLHLNPMLGRLLKERGEV